jgi:hypothetical protein
MTIGEAKYCAAPTWALLSRVIRPEVFQSNCRISHRFSRGCIQVQSEGASELTTEQELREKLRKIAALFEGATTAGERNAAAAASSRILAALSAAAKTERAIETQFTLPDRWARRLFTALCRRYGLEPYRYPRQRQTTVVLRAPDSFIHNTLWPEFLEIKSALDAYLNEATDRIIREEVFRDTDEAAERVG